LKPINIGEIIKVDAYVLATGRTSIHIAVDVYARPINGEFEKKTHCVIVFVSVDENGKSIPVKQWIAETPHELKLEEYAHKLAKLREQLSEEMMPFMDE
jgi:acyl-CoA hydrolase